MSPDERTDARLEAEAEEAARRRQAFLAAALSEYPPDDILDDLGCLLSQAEKFRLRQAPAFRRLGIARRLDCVLRQALGDQAADALVARYRRECEGYS